LENGTGWIGIRFLDRDGVYDVLVYWSRCGRFSVLVDVCLKEVKVELAMILLDGRSITVTS
jgi:hypothetical protein